MHEPDAIGKYEIIEQVAVGGFGVIYKGWDPFIKRTVAIKMCATPDEEVRQRFQQEAEFVGNLVHRNITLVFDYGVEDGVPYIVQEFLSGFDVDELLKAGVVQDENSIVSILLQVAEGLEFAHERGIVHRDIKPSNIRVLEDGTVKIMDFGIAKSILAASKLTQTGIALGTAGYLAPEQIQGRTIDARTDIFALGVVAYELVTGVRPFESATLSNVLYKILNEEPQYPADTSAHCTAALDRVIRKCMTKEPADRYQNAGELLAELRQIASDAAPDAATTKELTTGVLRRVMKDMGASSAAANDDATRRVPTPRSSSGRPAPTPQNTELRRTPETAAPDESGRNPVVYIFVVLLAILVAAAATLYLSKDAQDLVFGEAGAPWIPTPTFTPTTTPTPTVTPTVTATPTITPEPSPTPKPAPIDIRLVVDPPATVTIDGRPFGKGITAGGNTRLRPGTHTFTVAVPDFPTKTLTREVTGQTTVLSLTVEVGQISVLMDPTLTPPGGIAYLDGSAMGPIPIVRYKVPAGEHELVVRWDGRRPYRSTVDIPRLPNPGLRVVVAPPSD